MHSIELQIKGIGIVAKLQRYYNSNTSRLWRWKLRVYPTYIYTHQRHHQD